jgi:hypothetical protein
LTGFGINLKFYLDFSFQLDLALRHKFGIEIPPWFINTTTTMVSSSTSTRPKLEISPRTPQTRSSSTSNKCIIAITVRSTAGQRLARFFSTLGSHRSPVASFVVCNSQAIFSSSFYSSVVVNTMMPSLAAENDRAMISESSEKEALLSRSLLWS